jgi:hypothetical protein
LITIFWRDIPAQVTARAGRRKASVQLHERFQIAVDRAAVVADKKTTNDYLEEWRRVSHPCGPDLQGEVDAEVARIETAYSATVLQRLIEAGGLDRTTKDTS